MQNLTKVKMMYTFVYNGSTVGCFYNILKYVVITDEMMTSD